MTDSFQVLVRYRLAGTRVHGPDQHVIDFSSVSTDYIADGCCDPAYSRDGRDLHTSFHATDRNVARSARKRCRNSQSTLPVWAAKPSQCGAVCPGFAQSRSGSDSSCRFRVELSISQMSCPRGVSGHFRCNGTQDRAAARGAPLSVTVTRLASCQNCDVCQPMRAAWRAAVTASARVVAPSLR